VRKIIVSFIAGAILCAVVGYIWILIPVRSSASLDSERARVTQLLADKYRADYAESVGSLKASVDSLTSAQGRIASLIGELKELRGTGGSIVVQGDKLADGLDGDIDLAKQIVDGLSESKD
jgi:hypothetical protein